MTRLESGYRDALTQAEAKRGDLRVAEERLQAAQSRRDSAERELKIVLAEVERLESAEAPQEPPDPAALQADLKVKREAFRNAAKRTGQPGASRRRASK